jgi:hypothetical protein
MNQIIVATSNWLSASPIVSSAPVSNHVRDEIFWGYGISGRADRVNAKPQDSHDVDPPDGFLPGRLIPGEARLDLPSSPFSSVVVRILTEPLRLP